MQSFDFGQFCQSARPHNQQIHRLKSDIPQPPWWVISKTDSSDSPSQFLFNWIVLTSKIESSGWNCSAGNLSAKEFRLIDFRVWLIDRVGQNHKTTKYKKLYFKIIIFAVSGWDFDLVIRRTPPAAYGQFSGTRISRSVYLSVTAQTNWLNSTKLKWRNQELPAPLTLSVFPAPKWVDKKVALLRLPSQRNEQCQPAGRSLE